TLGFDLLLNYRSDEAAMNSTVEACRTAGNGRIERFKGAIGQTATRQSLIYETREEFGRLDLLVNNAGIAPKERLELLNTTEESFEQLIEINLKAPFFLTQMAARFMVETKAKLGSEYRPKIVTISSVSAYAAST